MLHFLGNSGYLNAAQKDAYHNYGIRAHLLKAKNFKSHHLKAMDILNKRYPDKDNHLIFSIAVRLNAIQVKGLECGLREDQVLSKNFGEHSIKALYFLQEQEENRSKDFVELFPIIQGYNEAQAEGFSRYGLTKEQVEHKDYNNYILIAIRDVMRLSRAKNSRNAFLMLIGLDKYRAGIFMKSGLNEEDVLNIKNFGAHTIDAMKILKAQGRAKTYKAAFFMVKGLDKAQCIGVSVFRYNRDKVENPNFMTDKMREILVDHNSFTNPQNTSKSRKYRTANSFGSVPKVNTQKLEKRGVSM